MINEFTPWLIAFILFISGFYLFGSDVQFWIGMVFGAAIFALSICGLMIGLNSR